MTQDVSALVAPSARRWRSCVFSWLLLAVGLLLLPRSAGAEAALRPVKIVDAGVVRENRKIQAQLDLCDQSKTPEWVQLKTKLTILRDRKQVINALDPAVDPAGALEKLEEENASLPRAAFDAKDLPKAEDFTRRGTKLPAAGSADAKRAQVAKDSFKKARLSVLEALESEERAMPERVAFLAKAKTSLTVAVGTCNDKCQTEALDVCKKAAGWGAAESLGTGGLSLGEAGIGSVGSLSWQTSLVTGLAKFLSDRAQAELVVWLVEEIQKQVCKEEQLGLQWFKETCSLLDPKKAYSSQPPGGVLAAAIRADIEALPARVLQRVTGVDENIGFVIIDVLLQLREGRPAIELIAGFSEDKRLSTLCNSTPAPLQRSKEFACTLMLVGHVARFSGEILTVTDEAKLQPLLAQAASSALAEVKRICATRGCAVPIDVDTTPVESFLRALWHLRSRARYWSNTSSASPTDAAVDLSNAAIAALDAGLEMFPTTDLVRELWPSFRAGFRAGVALVQGRYADGVRQLLSIVDDEKIGLPKAVGQYLPLLTDLTGAKDASDVEVALAAAAAPVGGWRDKRKTTMLSIGGLVGLGGGYEHPVGSGTDKLSGNGALTVMGAVGLDLSFPCGSASTFGFFVSVLDVGQLISTPLDPQAGTTASGEPSRAAGGSDFEIAQIFSPGAYIRFGLGNSPLAFGLGTSFAPQLRKYVTEDVETKEETGSALFSTIRVNAFLAVDLTLFPLYRKEHD